MNDLELLRSIDPAPASLPTAGRDELLTALRTSSLPSRRRKRRFALLGTGSAVLAIAGGGLAYAVLAGQPPQTALKVNCAVGVSQAEWDQFANFTGILDTSSGDPVADCAAEYVRLEGAAPPLRGYQTGSEYITVIPADWVAPASWRALPPTFRTDAARLELKQRLADLVDGPQSQCRTAASAEAMVRSDLAELSLTDWTVERLSNASKADGTSMCAMAWVDEGAAKKVQLQGVQGGPSGDDAVARLAALLRHDIAENCLTLAQAQRATESDIGKAGFKIAESDITALVDPAAKCTRVDLVPAGLIAVMLRGPKG